MLECHLKYKTVIIIVGAIYLAGVSSGYWKAKAQSKPECKCEHN